MLGAGAALVLVLAAQSALAPTLAVRGAAPSFVLVLVAAVAGRAEIGEALLFGALAGAGEDALAGTGAAWTIATALVAALAASTVGSLGRDARGFAALVALATPMRYLVLELVLQLEGHPLPGLHPAAWQTGENALVALIAAHLAGAVHERARENRGHAR